MGTELITITIPNWTKFNPRADRANYSWFRFQNDFFHDQKVFQLTDAQIKLYVFFLCEASKKNCGTVELSAEYISAILRHSHKEILKNLEGLQSRGLLTAESRHEDGDEPSLLPATYVRTKRDVRDETRRNETRRDDSVGAVPAHAVTPPARYPGQIFVGTYVKAYQSRYGEKTRPSVTGKVSGLMKKFLDETPIERACDLIQVYLQMDDPWFITKCHDFVTFQENLNKISLALDTGEVPGKPKRRGIEEILDGGAA